MSNIDQLICFTGLAGMNPANNMFNQANTNGGGQPAGQHVPLGATSTPYQYPQTVINHESKGVELVPTAAEITFSATVQPTP